MPTPPPITAAIVAKEMLNQFIFYVRVGHIFFSTHWMITTYLLLMVSVTFVCICGDTEDEGATGVASRTLMQNIPQKIGKTIKAIFGTKVHGCLAGTIDYVINQRNPILQIAYLLIFNCAFACWLIYGVPQLPTFLASEIHIYGGYITAVICQVSFYFACTVGPGTLTKENVDCFTHEAHDGLLFVDGMQCKTCKVPKPARSKHCSLCGFCVPTFDHRKIFIPLSL
jgi:hypothetical protein